MKSTELSKITRKLILPDRFKKKGRLAYYTLAHKTGAMVLVGFYLDNSIDPNSFFTILVEDIFLQIYPTTYSIGVKSSTSLFSTNSSIEDFTSPQSLDVSYSS